MMTHFSLTSQPLTVGTYNDTRFQNNNNNNSHSNSEYYFDGSSLIFIAITTGIICLLGIVGNANVIWFLGFRIKRNPFTTYVLNLAVADFILLLSVLSQGVCSFALNPTNHVPEVMGILFFTMLLTTYHTGEFLLTIISVDRCLAVVFPIWHRCHRPSCLSTIVCALIWLLSFLYGMLYLISEIIGISSFEMVWYANLTSLLCLPCMIISALIILSKVCFKSQQPRRGKLLRAILLTVFFFLVLTFPLNCAIIMANYVLSPNLFLYSLLDACLSSSVNPLIYCLAGRRKRGRSRESMKVILQRLFKEEELV